MENNERSGLLIVEFGSQKVSDADLSDIVDDELVVEQSAAGGCRFSRAQWNSNSIIKLHSICRIWSDSADTFRRVFSWWKVSCVVISMQLLVHFSQGYLAKQENTCAVFP